MLEHSQQLVRIAQAVATMCCGPCAADPVAADPVLRTCAADLCCGPLCLLLLRRVPDCPLWCPDVLMSWCPEPFWEVPQYPLWCPDVLMFWCPELF